MDPLIHDPLKMLKFALFDSDPAAQAIWQSSVDPLTFRFQTGTSLENLRNALYDETMVVVVDVSIAPVDFLTILSSCAMAQPHHVYIGTGGMIAVNHIVELMQSGVAWMFDKPLRRNLINEAMPRIVEMANATFSQLKEYRRLCSLFQALTIREHEVLDLIMEGVSNKDSASQLQISVRTVESRRAKVYHKFETDNMVELPRKIERLSQLQSRFGAKKSDSQQPVLRSHLNQRQVSVG